MIKVELPVPGGMSSGHVVEVVEQASASLGLNCVRKGTLASYPGCIHWHLKMGTQKGILEITWWEAENRLWFKVAKGRLGDWMTESITALQKKIESSL